MNAPRAEASEVTGSDLFGSEDVFRKAVAGVAVVGLRGAAIRLLGLAGNLALARFLAPRDFGLVAIGTAFVVSAGAVADAGIGARLINGRDAPRPVQLESLLAIQLGVATVIAALAMGVGVALRGSALLVAVMLGALPFLAFRTPAAVTFEWSLDYRPIAVAELVEALVFHAVAIGAVAAGWGVWGVAWAVPIRALAGTAALVGLSPSRVIRPRLDWPEVRPLMAFGIRYQAVALVTLAREQALNLGTAAIAGVSVLGLWSLAQRLLQVPFLLFESLWRVSYPAMSRLVAAGHDPARAVERGVASLAIGTGLLLAALVAATPAGVPALLGPEWADAVGVVPWAAAGLVVSGPISVATVGYLYAVDDAGSVLRAVLLFSLAWVGVGLALLPFVGVVAIGVGWFAGAFVEAVVLGRQAARLAGAVVLRPLIVPAAAAFLAGATGWILSSAFEPSLPVAAGATVAAAGVYLAVLALFRRADLLDVARLVTRAARLARLPAAP